MHRAATDGGSKFFRGRWGANLPFCFSLGAFGGKHVCILETGRLLLRPPTRGGNQPNFVPD